jgi:hypothetical protein
MGNLWPRTVQRKAESVGLWSIRSPLFFLIVSIPSIWCLAGHGHLFPLEYPPLWGSPFYSWEKQDPWWGFFDLLKVMRKVIESLRPKVRAPDSLSWFYPTGSTWSYLTSPSKDRRLPREGPGHGSLWSKSNGLQRPSRGCPVVFHQNPMRLWAPEGRPRLTHLCQWTGQALAHSTLQLCVKEWMAKQKHRGKLDLAISAISRAFLTCETIY